MSHPVSVYGASRTLQGHDDVVDDHRHAVGVLGVSNGVLNNLVQELFQ